MEAQGTQPREPHEKARHKANLDRSAMVGFHVVAGVGLVSTLNNVRSEFEKGFIHGWGNPEKAPFRAIHTEYERKFQSNLERYMDSKKAPDDAKFYQSERIRIARDKRTDTAKALLEEFNIPTEGFRGWTEGNWKRFWQLGNKTKVATGATAIGLGVVTWVGYAIMRHTKYTLDEIDVKLDAKLNHSDARGR